MKFPCIKMSQYVPKPYEPFRGDINVKVDLSYYLNKNLYRNNKNDISKLAAKSDLASLKPEVDKLDIHKLKTVPIDLSTLSNTVDNQKILCMINQLLE